VLREILRTLRVDAIPAARRLGLVHEHAAIAGRQSRVGLAWEPHLQRCREAIAKAANSCSFRRRVLVIGAGDCLDLPVDQLATIFEQVVLTDVVVSPVARRIARKSNGKVVCALWDATGALAKIAENDRATTPDFFVDQFTKSTPLSPPEGAPDFIVSANCLSQLGLIPAASLRLSAQDESLPARCATAAAKAHLRWLAGSNAVRVLLADVARLEVSEDGTETKRENTVEHLDLRSPDEIWRWNIAPIPEWHPSIHRIHEVGAWIDHPAQ
jgi:hypothetical protein